MNDEEDCFEKRSCKILLPREAGYKSNLNLNRDMRA